MAELVPLPIDADVAASLADQDSRRFAGGLVSAMLRAGRASDPRAALLTAIGQIKVAAHRNGLTDALLDDELRHNAAALRRVAIR